MKALIGSRKIWMTLGLFMLLTIPCIVLLNCSGLSGDSGTKLEAGFKNPPESAKPRVWWHWMNGNISKEGILRSSKKD